MDTFAENMSQDSLLPYSGFVGQIDQSDASRGADDCRLLATTATSAIWLAESRGRRRIYKTLAASHAHSEPYRKLLRKEAGLMAMLSHPAIVAYYGLAEVDGLGEAIEMEWVDGRPLAEWLAGRPSRQMRRRIAAQIIEAVAYIHSKGVVHRDIKPANILITHDGAFARLIDFGLADTAAHTELKNPAGTEGYMSARQSESYHPLTTDDLYALRIVIGEILPEDRRYVARMKSADAAAMLARLQRHWRRRARRRILVPSLLVVVALAAGLVWWARDLRQRQAEQRVQIEAEAASLRSRLADTESRHRAEVDRLNDSISSLTTHTRRVQNAVQAASGRRATIAAIIRRESGNIQAIWDRTDGNWPDGEKYAKTVESEQHIRNYVSYNADALSASELAEVETALRAKFRELHHQWTPTNH